jgi:RNA polymerase sigma-70 factor (ECF subfamily)
MGDDFALLARWRAGDKAAGSELFERHFDAVYRFFAHKVVADAADLVQRTFLACVEAKDRFREASSFRTFLFAIAHHELYAHWRKLKRDECLEVGSISVADLGASPSKVLLERREDRVLLEALRTIPLEFQLALELYYCEELSGPELAEVLDVPEGTARSRVRRALEALRNRLGALEETPLSSTGTDMEAWAASLRSLRDALVPRGAAPGENS